MKPYFSAHFVCKANQWLSGAHIKNQINKIIFLFLKQNMLWVYPKELSHLDLLLGAYKLFFDQVISSGGSRIFEMGVHMYKGERVRFDEFISFFLNIP